MEASVSVSNDAVFYHGDGVFYVRQDKLILNNDNQQSYKNEGRFY